MSQTQEQQRFPISDCAVVAQYIMGHSKIALRAIGSAVQSADIPPSQSTTLGRSPHYVSTYTHFTSCSIQCHRQDLAWGAQKRRPDQPQRVGM